MSKNKEPGSRPSPAPGPGKSFVVRDPQRLSSAPSSLVEALRQLGDDESAEKLVEVYVKKGEPRRRG